jgi:hypothetical protein
MRQRRERIADQIQALGGTYPATRDEELPHLVLGLGREEGEQRGGESEEEKV